MVLEVEDFSETTLTPEDYEGQAQSKAIPVNKRSASQLAAGQTVLSTGSREEYEESKAQLLDPEAKSQFLMKQDKIRQSLFEDAKVGLVDIISNPNTSQEEKAMAFAGASADMPDGVMTSTLDTLAEEAVIADSGPDENARTAQGRDFLAESVQTSNKYNREMTNLINGMGLEQGLLATGVDIVEMMAPFAEWIHYDRLLKELGGEADTNMLGEQKQKVFDHIRGMPIEDRAAVAQGLADLIADSDTMVLPDGNDLATLESLQNMLLQNEYSDFERYFDDVTSVFEVLGIGGVLRSLGKAAKAENALRIANKEKGILTMPEDVAGEMKKARREARIEAVAETAGTKVGETIRKAKTYFVRTDVVPTSPSQTVKSVNPELARNMHKEVLDDDTGEAAQALYGTTKDEVLGKDTLHEPEIDGSNMPNKVEMDIIDEPEHIKEARRRNGNTILSDEEKNAFRTKVKESLADISGMVLHPSSIATRLHLDDTTGFTARYSPQDSGFESAADAIEAAEVAFRNYGLKPDNFSILARKGEEWVKVDIKDAHAEMDLKAAGAKGEGLDTVDYAIGIDFKYSIRPEDFDNVAGELDHLTTATGLVARIVQYADGVDMPLLAANGQGSVVQHVLDPASVIHPRITGAASVAVDRTLSIKQLYVQEFTKFNDGYGALPKARRAAMTDYIHEANLNGIPFSVADLSQKGFNAKEIALLKDWKRSNDIMWHAANEDMVQSLRSRGVRVFSHKDSDTTLMGRPISKERADGVAYDATTGATVKKSKEELDELYASGGEVMELTDAIEIDGRMVDRVISPNTPAGGFNRVLRNDEKVLAYREGYYPVMYDANRFIYKIVKGPDGRPLRNSNGEEVRRVFATTNSTSDAKAILKGIQKRDKLSDEEMRLEYGMRKDNRFERSSNAMFDEGAWSVSSNTGLTSQRLRGKRLNSEYELDNMQGFGKEHLRDPLEAVANQIQHLSQRVSMRNYMDMVKKRWMLQFADDLDLPVNPKTGKVDVPKSISQVKGKSGVPNKIVRDARSNYNYISSLENGYINIMDKAYRGSMLYVADLLGEKGFSLGEKAAFGAAKISPTQFAKSVAFKLFISANPLRQAIIQRGQMVMLGAHNPEYAVKYMLKDLYNLRLAQNNAKTSKHYKDLWAEVQEAGIIESVDAHNLVRDDLLRLADFSATRKWTDRALSPINYLQRVGFDWAEQDVLLSAWLSARDKFIKANEKLPKAQRRNMKMQSVKDEILAETRAFTLSMNRAGEMPYSQNSLAIATQFLSFQHKALVQGFTNRNLTKMQKAQLVGYSALIFGMDTTIIYGAVDAIFGKEPSDTKDIFKDGLMDVTFNGILTAMSGENQAISFSDLAPSEANGMFNTFASLLTTDLPDLIKESPSGSLMWGASPRVRDAFTNALVLFTPMDNYNDPELKINMVDVASGFGHAFSGASNALKANWAFKYRQKMSSTGNISDDDVTAIEAFVSAFGFRTKDEESQRKINESKYANYVASDDDVDLYYAFMKRHLARRYETVWEKDNAVAVAREAWTVFGDDRENVINKILDKVQKDADKENFTFVEGIIKQMGLTSEDALWEQINLLPKGVERDRLVDLMKHREDTTDGS